MRQHHRQSRHRNTTPRRRRPRPRACESMLHYTCLETDPMARSWADAANLRRPLRLRRRPHSRFLSTFSPTRVFGGCRHSDGLIFANACAPHACIKHRWAMAILAFAARSRGREQGKKIEYAMGIIYLQWEPYLNCPQSQPIDCPHQEQVQR